MRKFSDLDIRTEGKIFECTQVSITDVVNVKIIVNDFIPNVTTRHGEGRYLIHCTMVEDGEQCKFFTTSKDICSALELIGKDNLPFETTIKAIKTGNGGRKYKFT